MPERQRKRVDCKDVQGEGAYMLIQPLTFAERTSGLDVNGLMEHVVEWNWVDWDGNQLPLPHNDEARQLLTDWETEFILTQFGLIFRGENQQKN